MTSLKSRRRAAEQRLIAQTVRELAGRCPHELIRGIEMAQCELTAGHGDTHVTHYWSVKGKTWKTYPRSTTNRTYGR